MTVMASSILSFECRVWVVRAEAESVTAPIKGGSSHSSQSADRLGGAFFLFRYVSLEIGRLVPNGGMDGPGQSFAISIAVII